jgi:hypothetical protein
LCAKIIAEAVALRAAWCSLLDGQTAISTGKSKQNSLKTPADKGVFIEDASVYAATKRDDVRRKVTGFPPTRE